MHYLNKPAPQIFLAHHGIKGQKWGIRRFQNEDGTLTKAGIERYAEVSSKSIKVNEDGRQLSLKDLHSTVLVEHSLIRINLVDCMLVTGKPMRRVI